MLGLPATAVAPRSPDDPPKAGPDDLSGRVVDKTGAGVAGIQVWAMDGPPRAPETVARAMTDDQGRFAVPWPQERRSRPGAQNFSLFARGPDGRVGWWLPGRRFNPDGAEIELLAVGDIRGRLTGQDGRPIAGVAVTTVSILRSNIDGVWLSPEPAALLRTSSAEDGSFVLKGIPHGASISATIAAPAFATPIVHWDTSQAVTIALDSRLGRIDGRLRPTDARGIAPGFPLQLQRSWQYDKPPPGRFELLHFGNTTADKDGKFRFDGLPPGRYAVEAYFDQDGLIASHRENPVEVGPGADATLEIAAPARADDLRSGRRRPLRQGHRRDPHGGHPTRRGEE